MVGDLLLQRNGGAACVTPQTRGNTGCVGGTISSRGLIHIMLLSVGALPSSCPPLYPVEVRCCLSYSGVSQEVFLTCYMGTFGTLTS